MRLLCFDIGGKRTGIAMASTEAGTAGPVGFIVTDRAETLLDRLAAAVEEYGPDEIVIGLPVNMDGSHGPAARRIMEIAERLSARTELPVHLQDERLTTFAADQALAGSGLTHGAKKDQRDALAATVILKDYLERHQGQTE